MPPFSRRWPREAVFVLPIFALILIATSLASLRSPHYRRSREIVARIADRLDTPLERGHSHPESSTELAEQDGWGHPVQVEYHREGSGEHLSVTSAGRDGRFNTPDDITETRWLPKTKSGAEELGEGLAVTAAHEPKKGFVHSLKHGFKHSAEAALEGPEK